MGEYGHDDGARARHSEYSWRRLQDIIERSVNVLTSSILVDGTTGVSQTAIDACALNKGISPLRLGRRLSVRQSYIDL